MSSTLPSATRTGSTPVGDIPLPEPGDSDIFFNLNRFDTGVALDLFNIQAVLSAADFANAGWVRPRHSR